MIINSQLLDGLTAQAKVSPRLRMNLDLRNSSADSSQRMLNAIEPGVYFGYFNCMFEMKKGGETMIILHRNNDIYRQLSSQEIAIVVNRVSESFNSIGASWPYFNYQEEWAQLCDDTWGRTLNMDDAVITLTKFKKLPMLELMIQLK